MISYLTCYSGCQDIWKASKLRVCDLGIYCSSLFSTMIEDFENDSLSLTNLLKFCKKAGYCLHITRILSNFLRHWIFTTTISSQCFSIAFKQAYTAVRAVLQLLPHVQDFKFVFTKEDFNTLLDHYKWNHTIELVPGIEPKLFKVYLLSLVKQSEIDVFPAKNLYTDHIHPSKFPIAMPVFFIKKKNSFLQLVQDYKILNAVMVKN